MVFSIKSKCCTNKIAYPDLTMASIIKSMSYTHIRSDTTLIMVSSIKLKSYAGISTNTVLTMVCSIEPKDYIDVPDNKGLFPLLSLFSLYFRVRLWCYICWFILSPTISFKLNYFHPLYFLVISFFILFEMYFLIQPSQP